MVPADRCRNGPRSSPPRPSAAFSARVGKCRWRIEAFFKTVKGHFGLERFAQHSKQRVMRWWCLSGMAFLLCHL
ncbi:transposase [Deinococcus sp. Leaf326]|uniref:transposase n=1 Tax=Deinococcus sp. Leaf326 TaxID=1736338 RepID=UPI0009E82504